MKSTIRAELTKIIDEDNTEALKFLEIALVQCKEAQSFKHWDFPAEVTQYKRLMEDALTLYHKALREKGKE